MQAHRVLLAILFLSAALVHKPADACFAPIMKQDPVKKLATPSSVMLGATTVVLASNGKKQTTTIVPAVRSDGPALRKFAILMPVKGKVSKRSFSVLTDEVHFQLLNHSKPIVERVVDPNPCASGDDIGVDLSGVMDAEKPAASKSKKAGSGAAAYGVKVEGHFEVGEYDIALLSAKNAKGLAKWLRRFKYTVDKDVEAALGDYLKSGHRLVVARVHLKKLLVEKFTSLRPLSIKTTGTGWAPLPLRVAAASGEPVPLTVLMLGDARANLTSHRMLQLPTNVVVPDFVAEDFDERYERVKRHWFAAHGGGKPSALLEFAGPAPSLALKSLGAKPGAFLTRWSTVVEKDTPDLVTEIGDEDLYRTRFVAHVAWYPEPSDGEVCVKGQHYLRRTKRQLIEEAQQWEALSGTAAGQTIASFKRSYPKMFVKPKKRDPKKLKAKIVANDEEEGIAWYWKAGRRAVRVRRPSRHHWSRSARLTSAPKKSPPGR